MLRRALPALMLIVPALGLGGIGLALVAAAPGRAGAAGFGAAQHFAWRQAIGLLLGIGLGATAAQVGTRRLLAAAPPVFLMALVGTAAVFIPRIGVFAAGARRWIHLGPISGSPAPLLTAAVALWLAAAESGPAGAPPVASHETRVTSRRAVALLGALVAVLVMVLEPDFSAAATTLVVAFATVAAAGRTPARRLLPIAGLLLALLAAGALRSSYVDNRIRGFLSPESDRRGKGFEVLELAHAKAGAEATGLGRGHARRHLSSPASDYAFALVREELGRPGAAVVLACWGTIAAGAFWSVAAAAGRRDVGGRALAAGVGTALLVPAALHIAVCRGWLPIIGVTMPLLSYDPALTISSGAELGLLVAIAVSGTLGGFPNPPTTDSAGQSPAASTRSAAQERA